MYAIQIMKKKGIEIQLNYMINNLLIALLYIPEISDCIKIYQRTELLTFVLVHNTALLYADYIHYLLLHWARGNKKKYYFKKKIIKMKIYMFLLAAKILSRNAILKSFYKLLQSELTCCESELNKPDFVIFFVFIYILWCMVDVDHWFVLIWMLRMLSPQCIEL